MLLYSFLVDSILVLKCLVDGIDVNELAIDLVLNYTIHVLLQLFKFISELIFLVQYYLFQVLYFLLHLWESKLVESKPKRTCLTLWRLTSIQIIYNLCLHISQLLESSLVIRLLIQSKNHHILYICVVTLNFFRQFFDSLIESFNLCEFVMRLRVNSSLDYLLVAVKTGFDIFHFKVQHLQICDVQNCPFEFLGYLLDSLLILNHVESQIVLMLVHCPELARDPANLTSGCFIISTINLAVIEFRGLDTG